MSFRVDLIGLLIAISLASYACRAGGFWLMRFVAATPRVQAALRAAPLAVMIGIVVPAALRGGVAEWIGIAVTAVVMRFARRDLVAALAGVATVAIGRLLMA